MTMKGFRRMVIVDLTMERPGGFVPHLVYECDGGMYPLGGTGHLSRPFVWGPTIDEAKAQALNYNMDTLGLTQADMDEILSEIMALSERRQREMEETMSDFPLTAAFVRDGEALMERLSAYRIRPGGRS